MSCVNIRGGRAIISYIHYIALQRRALFMILTVNIGHLITLHQRMQKNSKQYIITMKCILNNIKY